MTRKRARVSALKVNNENKNDMSTQHTPGPWTWNDADASIWPAIESARRAPVATVFTAAQPESELSLESSSFSAEESANARLIAAAPELLAALEWCHELLSTGQAKAGAQEAARAAIAKAKGKH